MEPLYLYSTNTWLAYSINEQYYDHKHYVYCTPYFAPGSSPSHVTHPPTSTPREIYHSLEAEVLAGDRHSAKIAQNKIGITKGATVKRSAGQITEEKEQEIMDILSDPEIRSFRPVLYIINYSLALPLLLEVPIKERAHPFSVEYIIENLPRSYFEMIEL